MQPRLTVAIIIGAALSAFALAVLGVFDASIVVLLVVLTIILVNNASRQRGGMK